jgi:hypothetical protein
LRDVGLRFPVFAVLSGFSDCYGAPAKTGENQKSPVQFWFLLGRTGCSVPFAVIRCHHRSTAGF